MPPDVFSSVYHWSWGAVCFFFVAASTILARNFESTVCQSTTQWEKPCSFLKKARWHGFCMLLWDLIQRAFTVDVEFEFAVWTLWILWICAWQLGCRLGCPCQSHLLCCCLQQQVWGKSGVVHWFVRVTRWVVSSTLYGCAEDFKIFQECSFLPTCKVRASRFYQSWFRPSSSSFLPPSSTLLPANRELQISVGTAGPQLNVR